MNAALEKSLEKAWTVIGAATWSAIGGGVSLATDALDDATVYQGPLDWVHLRKLFITGALIGFVAWMRKEKALATPVPSTPAVEAADLKKSAEIADKQTHENPV